MEHVEMPYEEIALPQHVQCHKLKLSMPPPRAKRPNAVLASLAALASLAKVA